MCKSSNICIISFIQLARKLILCLSPVFGRFSQIFKTKFLVQALISQQNMNQIKRFIDQNLKSVL